MKIFCGQKAKNVDELEYLTYTHKHCPECDAVKSVQLFYRKKTKTSRGWAWDSYCIDCRRKFCRDYGANSKAARNKRLRDWRKKNPGASAKVDLRKRLKRIYGLTPEQVEKMRHAQNGKCAICERSTTRLLVDHCHTSGRVRSLLCQTCNVFLGWYEKKVSTIIRFQAYIDTHSSGGEQKQP